MESLESWIHESDIQQHGTGFGSVRAKISIDCADYSEVLSVLQPGSNITIIPHCKDKYISLKTLESITKHGASSLMLAIDSHDPSIAQASELLLKLCEKRK